MTQNRPRRVLVSAGDPSGDLILSHVIAHLRKEWDGPIDFVGLCGPRSKDEGVEVLAPSVDVAVVGLVEVLKRLPRILDVLRRLERELDKCDSLLCVDFPDFNLRLAKKAKARRKPVDYIIAPQVWAWRSGRLKSIKLLLRRLYTVLPFEEELFLKAGVAATFKGHPVSDLLPEKNRDEARRALGLRDTDYAICVMPGSRRGEIRRHLALLVESWDLMIAKRTELGLLGPSPRALVPLAPGWTPEAFFETAGLSRKLRQRLDALIDSKEWAIVVDSRKALMACDFGWIASGTATLEAGYYGLPHILVYRLSRLTALWIRQVSQYFESAEATVGLPNIILGSRVVPELLQHEFTPRQLAIETAELMANPTRMAAMTKSLGTIREKLGASGSTARIAKDLADLWRSEST